MEDTLIMNKVVPNDNKQKANKDKTLENFSSGTTSDNYDEEVAELVKGLNEKKNINVSAKDITTIMADMAVLCDTVKKQTALLENVTTCMTELKCSIDDMSCYYKTNNDYVEKVLGQLTVQDRRCIEILETVNDSMIKVSKLEGVQASIANATAKLKLNVQDAKNKTNDLANNVSEVKDNVRKVAKETELNKKETDSLRDRFERKTQDIESKLSILDKIKGLFK